MDHRADYQAICQANRRVRHDITDSGGSYAPTARPRRPAGPIDRTDHQLADWEILADAISQALGAKGIRRTDEHRRVREDMPPELYEDLSYYERWVVGNEVILCEKG